MIERQVSSPMKSASSSGPIGWLAPSFIAVSIASTDPTPAHVFNATGLHLVSLTVTDTNGQSDTATKSIYVGATDQTPMAQMSWGSLDTSNPNSVSFDGHLSHDVDGQITNYAWTYGDGSTGSGSSPDHTYAAAGDYSVSLSVTDDGGLTGSTCELVTTGQFTLAAPRPCPPLTITASDATMTYAGSAPAITPGFVGFIDGDTAASLSTQPTCLSNGTPTMSAGKYPGATSCFGAVDPKYVISYAPGSLTVKPAPLTVTPDSQSIVYGGPIPAATYQISGFVNGQNLASSGVAGTASCSSTTTTTSPAGAYPITCAAGTLTANNYNFSFVPGTLVISKHPATIAFGGETFFSTNGGTTASVTLTGKLIAAPGGTPDLSLAGPVYNLYKSSNATMATPDVTCHATVSTTGFVSCSIPNLAIDNWTVVLLLPSSDGYFIGPSSSAVVVTVYQPVTGIFATGGGWIVDPSYQSIPVAVSSDDNHGNFGFNVRYASGTTTPQGQFVYTFRGADGYDYQVKSTSWDGGGAAFSSSTASFAGKASVTVIDPSTGLLVNGLGGPSFSYRVDVMHLGSNAPTLALSVYDASSTLYHQAGSTGTQVQLGGGNIVIHS